MVCICDCSWESEVLLLYILRGEATILRGVSTNNILTFISYLLMNNGSIKDIDGLAKRKLKGSMSTL